MRYLLFLLSLLIAAFAPAFAAEDVILDALVDESNRSIKDLHLPECPAPFYVSYTIKEIDSFEITSSLGSDPAPHRSRTRYFIPEIHVGSPDLDNSNYGPEKDKYFSQGEYISSDDNYTAIRRTVWLNTDKAFKKAVETLEEKKAYLNENKIADRLPDMSTSSPVVSISAIKRLSCDEEKWAAAIKQLSEIFIRYPHLQKSKVWFQARQTNRWFVNNEGTRIRESVPRYALEIWAYSQAPDGTPVYDQEVVMSADEKKMPSLEELKKLSENLARRVSELCQAPEGQDYCGPVLFEGQAAAVFITDLLKPNLACAEDVVHPDTNNKIPGNPLKDMIGRRILPRYMSLVDDPRAAEFNGQELVGGYNFDDQGIAAQNLVLIENGILKRFCQSRTPTHSDSASNGHAMLDRSSASILELTSSQTLPPEQLRQKLIELGKEEGLKYVLIVRRLQSAYSIEDKIPPDDASQHDFPTHSLQPSPPVLVYRLNLETGKEELLRGLEFRYASLRSFRDIHAVGNDAAAYLVQPTGSEIRSLVTPSLLIGEIELQKPHPEHIVPPLLKSPLAETASH